jgi:5-formyltetrahydrofolate cyclo-ligase
MIVGAAHNCQQAQELPNDNWDWSLSYIVTDKAIIKAQGR